MPLLEPPKLTVKNSLKPVLFTVKSSISYKGNVDDDSPISGRAVTFDVDDFIHIREKYDDELWIG